MPVAVIVYVSVVGGFAVASVAVALQVTLNLPTVEDLTHGEMNVPTVT